MYSPAQVTNRKGGPTFTDEGRVSIIWKTGNFDMAIERGIDKVAKENPRTHIRFAMGQIVKSGNHALLIISTIERISILGLVVLNLRRPLPRKNSFHGGLKHQDDPRESLEFAGKYDR